MKWLPASCPFAGTVPATIFESILNKAPAPVVRLNPEVPPKLEEIINKALEKDRDLRYQHASEMRSDLQRLRRDASSGYSAAAIPAATPAKSPAKYWIAGAAAVLIVAAIGAAWFWRGRSSTSPQIESIAVLPFSSAGGNADADFLSDGLTESLIASLAHVPQLKVKSRNSVFRYKGKDVDLQQIGKDLTVDALLTGRVAQHGDMVQVTADLTSVQDNTEIWGEHYERKASDIISLQQQIAGDIAEKLRAKLSGAEKQQVTKQGTQNPEAYQLYVKGRYYWNKRTPTDLNTAISYFNQAIDKDPGYALAYSGLGESYCVIGYNNGDPNDLIPKAKAAAQKALELDPTLARPHAVLGLTGVGYDWNFSGGEAELRKALEIDPSDATAHQWLAELLAFIGGRAQESIAEATRARQLDPLSAIIAFGLGEAYARNRQYDQALENNKKLVADNPTFANVHVGLAWIYWAQRNYPMVIQEFQTYARMSGEKNYTEYSAALDSGYRAGGWPAAARKGAEVLIAQHQAKKNYIAPYIIAQLYAEQGDKDHAFQWLNTAYEEHCLYLICLPTDVQFNGLRSDPRYAELVRKVGFPQ